MSRIDNRQRQLMDEFSMSKFNQPVTSFSTHDLLNIFNSQDEDHTNAPIHNNEPVRE
jgi:hypothetical protein